MVKRERNIEVLQNLLKKIFPLAYEPNNGFRGLFSTGDIRERRIPSSIPYSVGSSLDICFDSRSSSGQMRTSVGDEMIQYGKVLNAIRNMVKILTKTNTDFCALFDYIPPEQKFLIRSIVPTREISWNQNGNAILLALDTYNEVSVNRVIRELTENGLNIQLYVYIEETQTIFKKS